MTASVWLVLGVGAFVGGGSMLWLLDGMGKEPSDPVPTAPRVPMDWVSTGEGWNVPGNDSTGVVSPVRVVELGSTMGAVEAGASTEVCARVVDSNRSNLRGARVSFAAEHGTLSSGAVETDEAGIACTRYAAPPQPGTVLIQATAEYGNATSTAARNVVEVIAAGLAHHDHEENAEAGAPAVPFVLLIVGGVGWNLLRKAR